ncbi:MAG: ATP-binding cassette domain-containing protein [Actinomycetota bacterium]|nr:ATP-binding cassette domain-containing protein [Actinomycetota bacterium]
MTLEGFRFSYEAGAAPVFDDVSLGIEEGSFVLVTGPTGSGKSTLLRAMNGLVPHFSGGTMAGRVLVHGRDTRQVPPRRLSDVVAFVPQDPDASFVVDRVEDELAYAMENLDIDASRMRRRVEETLDLLAIRDLRDRSVRSLSGGERQRVAIAAAMTPQPRMLLLDEPTSQLDPQGAEDVLAALQRLVHDLALTVVVAEHRLERVAGFVDRAIGCPGDASVVVGDPSQVLSMLGSGPPVTQVGRALGWRPPPLTVRDARRFARRIELPARRSRRSGTPGAVRVEVRRLSVGYGEEDVLRSVDLTARSGEVVAIVGRNGAGKTTLLRCVAGLHKPDAGTIAVEGGPPDPGKNVALCPQAPESILFASDVLSEVNAGGRDAHDLLDVFGIEDLERRHPRDLSAGQRVLVAVAAVAATHARVLLLDEPTKGLDPDSKGKLVRFLEGYAAAGNAVLCATHDVELVAELASRVVVLGGGEVIAEGDPSHVLADSPVFSPQMTRVFGNGWLSVNDVLQRVGR